MPSSTGIHSRSSLASQAKTSKKPDANKDPLKNVKILAAVALFGLAVWLMWDDIFPGTASGTIRPEQGTSTGTGTGPATAPNQPLPPPPSAVSPATPQPGAPRGTPTKRFVPG